jgi:hypothetical protein
MTTLSPERKKLLERIAKLLALSESTSFDAEAQAAREAALRLMAEHNIRMATVTTSGEPFEHRKFASYFDSDVWWDRRLRFAIARLNNCFPITWGGVGGHKLTHYGYTGRPSDLDAFEYILGIVIRQRTSAWNKYKADGGPDSKGKWLYGYALGVEDKVEALLRDLAAKMRTSGKGLVPLDLIKQAEAWYNKHYPPTSALEHHFGRRSDDGFAAGSNVNLYRGEVAQTRQVGQLRRITRQ